MSTETRTIRPFIGLGELETALDNAVLHFGPEPVLANTSTTVDLPPHEFRLRPVFIEWEADDDAFAQFKAKVEQGAMRAGIPLDALALGVVASSTYLKIADIIYICPGVDLHSLDRVTNLTEPERAPAFETAFSGFTVDLYLFLTRTLPPQPLRPHRLGTWIARSQFRIETTQGPAVLPPTPLTNEVREKLGLPAKTIRFIDFGDHDVILPYSEQESPVFYVDEELLAQINARRTAPASKMIQLQLAQSFIVAVVQRASPNPELVDTNYDDLRTTLLGSIIRVAAGPGATDQDLNRLVTMVRETPEYVIARAEHFIDLRSGYFDSLEEVES